MNDPIQCFRKITAWSQLGRGNSPGSGPALSARPLLGSLGAWHAPQWAVEAWPPNWHPYKERHHRTGRGPRPHWGLPKESPCVTGWQWKRKNDMVAMSQSVSARASPAPIWRAVKEQLIVSKQEMYHRRAQLGLRDLASRGHGQAWKSNSIMANAE